jgi:hypothetical protein
LVYTLRKWIAIVDGTPRAELDHGVDTEEEAELDIGFFRRVLTEQLRTHPIHLMLACEKAVGFLRSAVHETIC